MEIETEHGTVLLDDEDAHLVAGKTVKVRVNPTGGYRDVLVNGRPLHRLILPVGAGLDVDHINRNPLDNRRANLRPATRTQNLANRKGWGKEVRQGGRLGACAPRGRVAGSSWPGSKSTRRRCTSGGRTR